jgi:thiol:disulfide interchange protein
MRKNCYVGALNHMPTLTTFGDQRGKVMRKLVFLLVLAVFSISAFAWAAESPKQGDSKINWLTSMDQAIEQAKAQRKPILLDFFNPR